MNKIEDESKKIPCELKRIFETSPQDDTDWALVMYLFRYSSNNIKNGLIFEEKNVITIRKVAKWFDLEYDDVYKRLNRMMWWISIGTIYGYYKPFVICNITQMGVDTIIGMIDSLKDTLKIKIKYDN